MTRKDYIELATALKAARLCIIRTEPTEFHTDMLDGNRLSAEYIAEALGRDNPRFDRERFLKAAGVPS